MTISKTDKQKMVLAIKKIKKITYKMLKRIVPGYRRQQYAAIIAHVTMGTYE